MMVDKVEVEIDAFSSSSDAVLLDNFKFKVPLDMVMVHEDNAMPVFAEAPLGIAMFDGGEFVDVMITENLIDTIEEELGHEVDEIDSGIDAEDFEDGLEGKDVLVFPNLDADLILPPGAIAVIREFLENGGKMIIVGEQDNNRSADISEPGLRPARSRPDPRGRRRRHALHADRGRRQQHRLQHGGADHPR